MVNGELYIYQFQSLLYQKENYKIQKTTFL